MFVFPTLEENQLSKWLSILMQRCFFICPFVIVTDILRADRKLEVHVEKEKGGGDTTNVKLYRLIINII